jgi:Na+/proline symporter
MATTLGLAARALDLPVTIHESDQGLVPPAVAVHLLGPGGAFLITFQLFMAVTASGSAEQIAVASLFSYDVWKRYIQPDVDGKRMILISRISIFAWGVISGVLAIILLELKISLGWVYLVMGNFIGSAVCPIAFAITWRRCSSIAAVGGAVAGLAASMIGWLSVASSKIVCDPAGLPVGTINVATLGNDFAMLTGNVLALFVSPLVTCILVFFFPQDYNWEDLNKTTESYLIEQDRHAHANTVSPEKILL